MSSNANPASRLIVDMRPIRMLTRELQLAAHSRVLVGIQEGSQTRGEVLPNGRQKQGGQSMAQIGFENEYGTHMIPARPFVRPAISNNRQLIERNMARQFDLICQGQTTTRQALNLIGLLGVRLIQDMIDSIHSPPNSPRTIALKGSSKPLIDSGQMRASITYRTIMRDRP